MWDNNSEFVFSAMYGLHTLENRKSLWNELMNMHSNTKIPWLEMGDYNAILTDEDRKYGSEVEDVERRDLQGFLDSTTMSELRKNRRDYTWTNGHVFSRIDRALVNSEWMMSMSQMETNILDPVFSDHSPLCISLYDQTKRRARPFKFLNHLADHQEFNKRVAYGWSKQREGSTMDKFGENQYVKKEMKALNTKEFCNITDRVNTLRKELVEI